MLSCVCCFAGQWNQPETRDSRESCTFSKTQPSCESAYCEKERATFLRNAVERNVRKPMVVVGSFKQDEVRHSKLRCKATLQ